MIEKNQSSINCSLCSKKWLLSELKILPKIIGQSHIQITTNCYLINSAYRNQNQQYSSDHIFEVICTQCYQDFPEKIKTKIAQGYQFLRHDADIEQEKYTKIQEALNNIKRQHKNALLEISSLKQEIGLIKKGLGQSSFELIKQNTIFHQDAQSASHFLQPLDDELFCNLQTEITETIQKACTKYQENLLGKIEDSIQDEIKRKSQLLKLTKSHQTVRIEVLRRHLNLPQMQEKDNISDICLAKMIESIRNVECLQNLREQMWNYLLEGTCTYPDY